MSTPRYGHAPIAMVRRLPDLTEAVMEAVPWEPTPGGGKRKIAPCNPRQVGEFYWDLQNGKRQLVVMLPFQEGGATSSWSIDFPNHNGAKWSWDGNEDKPTLSPSLHWIGVWHGRVRNGQLIEA